MCPIHAAIVGESEYWPQPVNGSPFNDITPGTFAPGVPKNSRANCR